MASSAVEARPPAVMSFWTASRAPLLGARPRDEALLVRAVPFPADRDRDVADRPFAERRLDCPREVPRVPPWPRAPVLRVRDDVPVEEDRPREEDERPVLPRPRDPVDDDRAEPRPDAERPAERLRPPVDRDRDEVDDEREPVEDDPPRERPPPDRLERFRFAMPYPLVITTANSGRVPPSALPDGPARPYRARPCAPSPRSPPE